MTSRPWYPFYWSDYSGKTLHLTQGQHGAYMLLLRWVYTNNAPVPHKQRYSIAMARLDLERSDADAVLAEFFVRRGDGWHNQKAEEVIQDAHQRHQKYVEAGRAGGKGRSSDAQAMLKPSPTNHTHTHKEPERKILFNASSGNGSGKKNGYDPNTVTLKDPIERLAKFQQSLVPLLGSDGHITISNAMYPAHPEHADALARCKAAARQLGKGWPRNWPVNP